MKRPVENNTEVKRDTRFFKLPCIDKYYNIAQKKIQNIVKTFCKGIDVKVVLMPFKISNKFSYKDPLPFHLQSFIVYKFICANCKVCYVGETTRHFITRINEHLQKDAKSNIFKHLRESRVCNSVCNKDCFSVIDQATTEYQLKMKEAMHVKVSEYPFKENKNTLKNMQVLLYTHFYNIFLNVLRPNFLNICIYLFHTFQI